MFSGEIKIISYNNGEEILSLKKQEKEVEELQWSNDGKYLAVIDRYTNMFDGDRSMEKKNSIKIFNTSNWEQIQDIKGTFYNFKWQPSGHSFSAYCPSFNERHEVFIWNLTFVEKKNEDPFSLPFVFFPFILISVLSIIAIAIFILIRSVDGHNNRSMKRRTK